VPVKIFGTAFHFYMPNFRCIKFHWAVAPSNIRVSFYYF